MRESGDDSPARPEGGSEPRPQDQPTSPPTALRNARRLMPIISTTRVRAPIVSCRVHQRPLSMPPPWRPRPSRLSITVTVQTKVVYPGNPRIVSFPRRRSARAEWPSASLAVLAPVAQQPSTLSARPGDRLAVSGPRSRPKRRPSPDMPLSVSKTPGVVCPSEARVETEASTSQPFPVESEAAPPCL